MILNYANIFQGGDIEDLQVPVGGDQLTRVRLQGAKALRNGSLTSIERLEHLNPVIVEMFHTLQDFLKVMYAVNVCNTFIIKFSTKVYRVWIGNEKWKYM
jgi:hypothetical protein